jgi:sugar/nucleoside kinase (ribokinase family)
VVGDPRTEVRGFVYRAVDTPTKVKYTEPKDWVRLEEDMEILAVGSVALDTIEIPSHKVTDILGGSGTFFAFCASFFAPVRLVSVVGQDFPEKYLRFLQKHKIDIAGIVKTEGRSFRWHGKYSECMDKRETVSVEPGCLEDAKPIIPDDYRASRYVFLGNCSPELQLHILRQVRKPKLVFADTMDIWLAKKRRELLRLLRRVDVFTINDSEAQTLAGESSLMNAAAKITRLGPKIIVVKKGSNGVLLYAAGEFVALPAFPVREVRDTTGAGDSFAGGFVGSLAQSGRVSLDSLKKALANGTVMAQFAIRGFGLEYLKKLTRREIEVKFREYCGMLKICE